MHVSQSALATPIVSAVEPPQPVLIPPAEDWVRTPLIKAAYVDRQPAEEPAFFTAGSRSRSGFNGRDARGLLTDFQYLGRGAFDDAVLGAAKLADELSDSLTWIRPTAMVVLKGRDGGYWTIPLIEGTGVEPLVDATRPNLTYGVSMDRIQVTEKLDDVVAIVDGVENGSGRYADLRTDVNGSWSWTVKPLPM